MNRPLKFRAWDKITQSFIPIRNVVFRPQGILGINMGAIKSSETRFFEDIELMQFTGLKDKSGKEIYEGDIILLNDEQYLVQWDEHRMQFMAIGQTTWTGEKGIPGNPKVAGDELKDFRQHLTPEVIGNIYENPELFNPA